MKTIIAIACLLFLVSGCQKRTSEAEAHTLSSTVEMTVTFFEKHEISDTFYEREFEVDPAKYSITNVQKNVVTQDEALDAGGQILEQIQAARPMREYGLSFATYYVKNQIWVFSYSDRTGILPGEDVTGGLCVAVDGKSGEILLVWAEE